MLDGIDGCNAEPLLVGLTRQIVAPRPSRIPIRRLHPHPVVLLFEHAQRLSAQSLRDLLGILGGVGSERRELACERMFA